MRAEAGERTLYQLGRSRVVAWADTGPAHEPVFYVRVDRQTPRSVNVIGGYLGGEWYNVVTWPARVTPAPWWQPWQRKHELMAVVERAIRRVEEIENAERTAQVTLQAVSEAMDAAAPLLGVEPEPQPYNRVYADHRGHGDEDPPLYQPHRGGPQ